MISGLAMDMRNAPLSYLILQTEQSTEAAVAKQCHPQGPMGKQVVLINE